MPHHIRSAWLKTLATLAVLLLAAVLVGLATGHVWMCIALVSIGALVWHYWRVRVVRGGVTARPMDVYGLPHDLRVTVGTPEENQRFVECLAAVLERKP